MIIRSYISTDYEHVVNLYKQSQLYGGQFDEDRDSEEKLKAKIEMDPDSILIAEEKNNIIGTVSIIEDHRVAWLFRFCVIENEHKDEIAKALFNKACEISRKRAHDQVLIYSPVGDKNLSERYEKLGFTQGNDYTCFWKDI